MSGFSFTQRSAGRLVGATVLAMALASGAGATVLHVDDDAAAGGDGSSWATAHRFLRDALTAAALSGGTVSEIRVAQGVYQPDRTSASPGGNGMVRNTEP